MQLQRMKDNKTFNESSARRGPPRPPSLFPRTPPACPEGPRTRSWIVDEPLLHPLERHSSCVFLHEITLSIEEGGGTSALCLHISSSSCYSPEKLVSKLSPKKMLNPNESPRGFSSNGSRISTLGSMIASLSSGTLVRVELLSWHNRNSIFPLTHVRLQRWLVGR